MSGSPYLGYPVEDWKEITEGLVKAHPLGGDELRTLVTAGWNDVFASTIGEDGLKIGVDIFLKGQALGSFLHELIPRKFAKAYPSLWRPEVAVTDKDLVCIPDDKFSIELKTTSHPSNIPGNKSFAQSETPGKKLKDGYYLVVNYEKLEPGKVPGIKKIRFGWLDLSDWQGQSEDNGQGANVKAIAKKHKLIEI
jgi:hypothetical protein